MSPPQVSTGHAQPAQQFPPRELAPALLPAFEHEVHELLVAVDELHLPLAAPEVLLLALHGARLGFLQAGQSAAQALQFLCVSL